MATIRKHHGKWQVQIRRKGLSPITKSFHQRKDADLWARQTEAKIDLGDIELPAQYNHGKTVKDLMVVYRDKITPMKRSCRAEVYVINKFNHHKVSQKRLNEVTERDFNHAVYIPSWLKALQDDKSLIIPAANQATKTDRYPKEPKPE